VLLSLAGRLVAQAPRIVLDDPIRIGRGASLQVDEGTLLALGTDYKATFADGRVVYTPMLGLAAPRDLPFALEVTHTGRGELRAVGAAATTWRDLRVELARPELREQLDVRPEGLKQSFVFARLPAGRGDLVVRARVQTELRAERTASDGSMQFVFPGAGGVEVGQVIGIDANGARATGTLRTDGTSIDFVLPAAFVEHAALPLVLDPLLGTVLVAGGATADRDPDASLLGAPFNRYLVVWAQAVSAANQDLRAQRLTAAGALIGNPFPIESSATSADTVQVLESRHTSHWFVVWHQAGDIHGRFVDAFGAALGAFGIATGAAVQSLPDLGGGNVSGNSEIVCVWRDATANAIMASRIDALTQTAGPEVTLARGSALTRLDEPAISPQNPLRRLLVTWSATSTATGNATVRGLVIDPDATALSNAVTIAGSGVLNATDPSCAGDSSQWVVAYETASLLATGAACVDVGFDQGQITVGAPRTITAAGGPVRNPAVERLTGSVLIAYASPDATGHDVAVVSIDPLTCQDCEGTLPVNTVDNGPDVAICSRADLSPSLDEGLILFTSLVSAGDVFVRRFTTSDGQATRLIGGCAPGELYATCARVGNPGFAVTMRNGVAGAPVFAVLAFAAANVPCGPCRIVPDLATGFATALGPVGANGEAVATLPLPLDGGLIGLSVVSQFVYFGNACLGMFAGTGGLRFTIE
jgi:hypothetical protein